MRDEVSRSNQDVAPVGSGMSRPTINVSFYSSPALAMHEFSGDVQREDDNVSIPDTEVGD